MNIVENVIDLQRSLSNVEVFIRRPLAKIIHD